MGAPGRVLVGKERSVERRQEMLPLPASEVGDASEHHARDKEGCAELRAHPDSGGNQLWMVDIATSDGLDILCGATGEHFHMVRRRADSVGTASKLLDVMTHARQIEWRHPRRRRRFHELLERVWDVANRSSQCLPHCCRSVMRRDERRAGWAKGLSDAALGVRENRSRDPTNVFVGRWRIESFSERRREHAEVNDRRKAKEVDIREESRIDVNRGDRWHPTNDLICYPVLACESRGV